MDIQAGHFLKHIVLANPNILAIKLQELVLDVHKDCVHQLPLERAGSALAGGHERYILGRHGLYVFAPAAAAAAAATAAQ